MPWPFISDYSLAIQKPIECFDDAELRDCRVEADTFGYPKVWAGGFACVYSLQGKNRHYAVKCFFGEQGERRSRYGEVSKYLQNRQIHYLIEFEYIERGICVDNNWYPILKMRWVNGKHLNTYIEECLGSPDSKRLLLQLSDRWQMMLTTLQKNQMAHGDLQHGNALVTVTGELYLVDYDCMYVPTLKGNKSQCVHCGTFIKWYENIPLLSYIFFKGKCCSCKKSRTIQSLEDGHPNYQHPDRSANDYDDKLDDFAGLVIYTAIQILAVQPNLWDKFTNDENLLFTKNDFKNPQTSPLFIELKNLPNSEVVNLANNLVKCCKRKRLSLILRSNQRKLFDLMEKTISPFGKLPKKLKIIKRPVVISLKVKVISISFVTLTMAFFVFHNNYKKDFKRQNSNVKRSLTRSLELDLVSNKKLMAMYEREGDKAYEKNDYQEALDLYQKGFNIIKDYSDSVPEDTRRIAGKIAECGATLPEQQRK